MALSFGAECERRTRFEQVLDPAGEGPPWGWRVAVAHRPSGELVLQMTNIKPWGEDGRAVRMIGIPA